MTTEQQVRPFIAFAMAIIATTGAATAELSKKDQKEAQRYVSGKQYLRTDAPCTKGRHPYGVFYSPLVEISPEGINTEAESGVSYSWFHAASTIWPLRINDTAEVEDLDWDDEEPSVELELEGVGSADGRDSVLRFVQINSLDDFKKAADLAFAKAPLQDEHPDWSAEIKQAIGERRLLNGMTKRQAHYVVGTPANIEKSTEKGVPIEVWTMPESSIEFGYWGTYSSGPNVPARSLRFENGLLVSADSSQSGSKLDLDNP